MQANPLWPVLDRFPSLDLDKECEVVVVGGGIAGISCLYHLKKAGISAILIEKNEVGSSATGASSGVLYYGSGMNFVPSVKFFGRDFATMLWKETSAVIDEIASMAQTKGIKCGLRRCGAVMVAKNSQELEEIKQESKALREIGVEARLLNSDEIKEIFALREFVGGIEFTRCAQIHPAMFAAGLAKAESLEIYEKTLMKEILENEDGIVVNTDKNSIKCKKIIFATNREKYLHFDKHFKLESSAIIASKEVAVEKIWKKEKIFWTMEKKYDLIYPREKRLILEVYNLNGKKEKLEYYYYGINFEIEKTWGESWAKTNDWLPIVGEARKNIIAAMAMGDQGIVIGWLTGKHIVNAVKGEKDWFLEKTDPMRFHD